MRTEEEMRFLVFLCIANELRKMKLKPVGAGLNLYDSKLCIDQENQTISISIKLVSDDGDMSKTITQKNLCLYDLRSWQMDSMRTLTGNDFYIDKIIENALVSHWDNFYSANI